MKKSCPGFTLIELLVAMSIVGILFSLGVAKYQQFNRRQILVQAAQELKSNLRLAQDKALAGEKPSGWCSGADEALKGYRLYFSSDKNYKTEAVCSNSDVSPNTVKSVNLLGNVTGPSGEDVLFKVLAQGVDAAASFTLSGFGETQTITVSVTGEIR